MATEQEYDDIIAPMLAEVGQRCEELGMSLIARVEWDGYAGITQTTRENAGVGQRMTIMAAYARGNIDAVCMALLKRFDCSQSIFLAPFISRPIRSDEPASTPQDAG